MFQFDVYDSSVAAKGAVKVLVTVYARFVGVRALMRVKPRLSVWIPTWIRMVQSQYIHLSVPNSNPSSNGTSQVIGAVNSPAKTENSECRRFWVLHVAKASKRRLQVV